MVQTSHESFGATEPFAEPYWYGSSGKSPFYTDGHRVFRQKVRDFVEAELRPNVDQWDEEKEIPSELISKAYAAGVYTPQCPKELGGTPPPEGFDAFHDLIWIDELSRWES
jgi:alkylation response protein AidB-like acyl-CoA dehydrogenase